MNLYQIKEKLLQQERAVFTQAEISRICNVKKSNLPVYVNRMKKKKLLFSIEKNKLSVVNDPFVIASQLLSSSYLSLNTALYLHNLLSQVINRLEVITTRKKRDLNIMGVETTFKTISPSRLFGYQKIKKGNSYIMLAEIEKVILDGIYFQKDCHLSLLLPALNEANIPKLEEYAYRFAHEGVLRRLGYLLDYSGIPHKLKRNNNNIFLLNPARKKRGKFNNKWYLYINEVL